MDFTLSKYKELLEVLKDAGYKPLTFSEYIGGHYSGRFVILRHDVDRLPENSLRIASLENGEGMKATYYFRAHECSWNEVMVRKISDMGHEVGYHYENMDTCNGNVDDSYRDFCKNLQEMSKVADISSICMHGSPRSKYDNRDIWKKYSYKNLGLSGEPYIDTDFSKVLYLSDTGRRWDGFKVSIRDKIEGVQSEWQKRGWMFHSTNDIVSAVRSGSLPDGLMLTTHPQRWNPFGVRYIEELLFQNIKNVVKYFMAK